MTEQHPLVVSNKVLCQWYRDYLDGAELDRDEWPAGYLTTYIGVKAAQWGYDQALQQDDTP